jgi:phage baseplate assembly protein W
MAETAISLPFSLDAYGRITSTVSQQKIFSDRVLSVIGTNLKERVMLVEFGTKITSYLYGSVEKAISAIPGEIEQAFAKFLPTLTYSNTNVIYDEQTGTLLLDIIYELPNGETNSTTLEIVAIASKNPPVQETL